MLVDRVRTDFFAGKGGKGHIHFEMNGKPDGGDGGHGGNVYLIGDENTYDLRNFQQKKFIAQDGEQGSSNNRRGANANDLLVKVPLITKVYDLEKNLLFIINSHEEKVLVAKAGNGGRGNHYFRRGQLETLNKFTNGYAGEKVQAFLELELKSDVVFIGLPNAGKSSMLNTLTNTKVKVADYPFTTLVPYLGIVDGIKLMDLPGLIEGTSKGKGLGSNFSKHTRNTKAIAHFLSLDEENLKKSYDLIRNELKEIDKTLLDKPELLVLTKSDNYSEKEIKEKVKAAKEFHKNLIVVSILKDEELIEFKKKLKKL